MSRKRTMLVCLVCAFLLLNCQSAMAESGGGSETKWDGQSDIMAGVSVDYMGKMQFLATDQDTGTPIEGTSIEIYIPSLDRYVLFGVTDADGILELDVAYGDRSDQYTGAARQSAFSGTMLYLKDNQIAYRAYKSGWLPYPFEGSVELGTKDVPQVIPLALYKKKSGGGGGGGGGGSSSSTGTQGPGQIIDRFPEGGSEIPLPDSESTGGIPKTGVEGTMQYWIAALFFFLIAGGIIGYLLKTEKEIEERQHRFQTRGGTGKWKNE